MINKMEFEHIVWLCDFDWRKLINKGETIIFVEERGSIVGLQRYLSDIFVYPLSNHAQAFNLSLKHTLQLHACTQENKTRKHHISLVM